MGPAGTGIFTQTGGTNLAGTVYLGGALGGGFVRTPGTYNLNGGLLQATYLNFYSDSYGNVAPHIFNFTGGTLQAGPGATAYYYAPITLAATSMCTLDMNGQTVNLTSLTTTPGLTTFNFADPTTYTTSGGASGDLLSVPGGGLTVNPNTYLTFGTDPTAVGTYELIADTTDTFTLGNFSLPTAPTGVTYSLATDVSGNVDLVVAAVPEPGTLALLGVGLMSLLGFAWRRRKAG